MHHSFLPYVHLPALSAATSLLQLEGHYKEGNVLIIILFPSLLVNEQNGP